jgi:pilus assembly protein Flp/PilA
MRKLLWKLWRDERGATMVEYGIMVALIAAVCITAVTAVGGQVNTVFNNIVTALKAAT